MRLSLGSIAAVAVAAVTAFGLWPDNRIVKGPAHVVAQEKPQKQDSPAPVRATSAKPHVDVPIKVDVVRPVTREIVDSMQVVGTLAPSQSVQIRALVTGYLVKAMVQQGAMVKEGDVLFEIDPRLCQAEVEKANADLAAAVAQFKQANISYEYTAKLNKDKVVSKDEVALKLANRDAVRAKVQLAQAQREIALLNLSYTKIKAPITGRLIGLSIDPGNLVRAQETKLAEIVVLDPMRLQFRIADAAYFKLERQLIEARSTSSSLPIKFTVSGETQRRVAQVTGMDYRFDSKTGTLGVEAVVPNADGLLIPGLSGMVDVTTSKPYRALLLPEQSLHDILDKWFVWVVNERNVVEQRAVTNGRAVGELRVIPSGLKGNERVVVSQNPILRDGLSVEPKLIEAPH